MKTILITGAGKKSFVGRNLTEFLRDDYQLLTPPHAELELLDQNAVEDYVLQNKVDIIIHGAIHVPSVNGAQQELAKDLTMFFNLSRLADKVEKMIYFGSGAEYDKRFDIRMVREEDFGHSVPDSDYGLAKYAMNEIARRSDNIYNLRLFGVFGKYEAWPVKFLSNLCCKAVFDLPLTVRRDCYFDFIHIDDLCAITRWLLENPVKYHDYNACSGNEYLLTTFAQKILAISGKDLPIQLLSEERNLDYSGSNQRLCNECPAEFFTPIDFGLQKLFDYYETHRDLIDLEVLRASR